MKTTLVALMLLATNVLSAQQKLTIAVDGIEKIKGQLFVAIYDDEANFLKKPAYVSKAKVEGENIEIVLSDVKPGNYAVSIFHDENDNQKLDMGAFGPTEKTGFSNNAKGMMGPPKFNKCLFKVEEDAVIYITLE